MNKSGIRPAGHRLLVKPDVVEEVSTGGIVLVTKDQKAREQLAQVKGTLVAIGDTAWADQPKGPWAKVGDKVSVGKYAGLLCQGVDGCEYRIVSDLDLVSIYEEE